MSPRRRCELIVCLLLGVLTVAAFYQVAGHEFVNFDDDHYLTQNPHVQQGLTYESLKWAFTSVHAANWHPFTWLSHMLDWRLYGNNPRGHHLTNLAIHVVNTWLLFLVLYWMTSPRAVAVANRELADGDRRATRDKRKGSDANRKSDTREQTPANSEHQPAADTLAPCALVAALFAVHPLHVESVAWVSERKDTLSTLFWLLTMAVYWWYVTRPSVARYLLVGLSLAAGLLAKQMVVTLPFAFLLLDYWPLGRWSVSRDASSAAVRAKRLAADEIQPRHWPSLLLEKVPLFALVVAGSILAYWAQKEGGTTASLASLPLGYRLANAALSYVAYLGKAFWPVDLICFYPHRFPTPAAFRAALPSVAAAVGLLAVITAAVVLFGRRRRYLLVGWLWYVGTLVPVSGIVQVGAQGMADRFTYVPLIGVFIMLAFGLDDFLKRRSRRASVIGWSCAALVVLVLADMTWWQVRVWRDSQTLFGHAVEVMPDNVFAHTELAAERINANDLTSAEYHAREALRIDPSKVVARHHLALILIRTGHPIEALTHLRVVIQVAKNRPNVPRGLASWPNTANDLAWSLATHPDAASRDGKTAVELAELATKSISPEQPAYLDTLAAAYAEAGRFDDAVATAERALELAQQDGLDSLAADVARRLASFQNGKPWRE